MRLSSYEIGFEGLDRLSDVDSLCLFVSEDERPLKGTAGYVDWRLCGALSRVLMRGFFSGSPGEQLLLPSEGRIPVPRVFVVGMGSLVGLTAATLGTVMAGAARMLSRAKVEAVAVEVPAVGALDEAQRADALMSQFLPAFEGRQVAVLAEKTFARLLPGMNKGEK